MNATGAFRRLLDEVIPAFAAHLNGLCCGHVAHAGGTSASVVSAFPLPCGGSSGEVGAGGGGAGVPTEVLACGCRVSAMDGVSRVTSVAEWGEMQLGDKEKKARSRSTAPAAPSLSRRAVSTAGDDDRSLPSQVGKQASIHRKSKGQTASMDEAAGTGAGSSANGAHVWEFDWNCILHEMHARGINMRHLGRVYDLVRCDRWRRCLLLEMASRAVKVDFRASCRECLAEVKLGTSEPFRLLALSKVCCSLHSRPSHAHARTARLLRRIRTTLRVTFLLCMVTVTVHAAGYCHVGFGS
jgi:hypothetical protein